MAFLLWFISNFIFPIRSSLFFTNFLLKLCSFWAGWHPGPPLIIFQNSLYIGINLTLIWGFLSLGLSRENFYMYLLYDFSICLDRIQFIQSAGGETVCCTSLYGAIRFTRNVDIYKRVIILKINLTKLTSQPC